MKKLLPVFLFLTVWLSAFGYDFHADGIYYNIIDDNQVEVTYPQSNPYFGNVTIPSSVTYNNVTYSVTSISSAAFYGSYGLISVTIPNSVTSIGTYAFSGCSGLTSVTIPKSVTSISYGAFYDCSGLTSIIVAADNSYYDSRNNCNAIIETATNSLITGCMNTVIPNSVTSIGSFAFKGCSGLTSVTIPDGVTTIYESAFAYCDKLVTLSIPSSVISIEIEVFYGCENLAVINCNATTPPAIHKYTFGKYDATLYVPANSVGLYQSSDYWKNFFIMPIQEDGLEYSLADRNVDYLNGRIYNENGLEIRLYDASGRLVTYSDGDIDMSNCPNGIYIVTDNKGGSLKIVHRR